MILFFSDTPHPFTEISSGLGPTLVLMEVVALNTYIHNLEVSMKVFFSGPSKKAQKWLSGRRYRAEMAFNHFH